MKAFASSIFGKRYFASISVLILLILLSLWWHYSALLGARQEYTSTQIQIISGFVFLILVGQILTLACLQYIFRHSPRLLGISNFISAMFLTINFFSLYLVHMTSFAQLDDVMKWAAAAVSLFSSHALLSAMRDSRIVSGFFVATSALLLTITLLTPSASQNQADDHAGLPKNEHHTRNERYIQNAIDRKVVFPKKPNVYLIAFDALTPEVVAQKHLGDIHLAYDSTLKKPLFRHFSNAFADRVPTKASLNSLLTLDIDLFDGFSRNYRRGMFNGQNPSIVYEIFKQNGYKVQSIYKSNYFGADQGQYVDYYETSSTIDPQIGICKFIESPYAFLGFCHPILRAFLERPRLHYPDFLFDRIVETANSRQPWFTISYIYNPGHTKKSYQHDRPEDREKYREHLAENSKVAAGYIAYLTELLEEHDPNSILLVFGDHGAWMSRGKKFFLNNGKPAPVEDRTFFIQDRHAIEMALWPQNACRKAYDRATEAGYITIARATRALIECLADGVDPVPQITGYRLPYIHDKHANKDDSDLFNYRNYLYE